MNFKYQRDYVYEEIKPYLYGNYIPRLVITIDFETHVFFIVSQ